MTLLLGKIREIDKSDEENQKITAQNGWHGICLKHFSMILLSCF